MITYYAPGEAIPQTSTLGNSPVGVGGGVSTATTQVINDGNAVQNLVEATVAGDASSAVLLTTGAAFTLGTATRPAVVKLLVGKTTVAGSVSGSADVYYILKGDFKWIFINYNAMKTNNVNFVLPVAFTSKAQVQLGDCVNLSFLSGGVAQNLNRQTGINSFTTDTQAMAFSMSDVLTGFDTIRFTGNGTAAHSGTGWIMGV